MSNLVSGGRHLSPEELKALKEGTFQDAEIMSLLEHISDCSSCAAKFAGCFREDELLEVPSGFRENIMSRLEPEKVDDYKVDQRQQILYSIRVVIAACATLVLIFSGALNLIAGLDNKLKGYDFQGQRVVETINTSFQDFSQKVLNMEAFLNEDEKK